MRTITLVLFTASLHACGGGSGEGPGQCTDLIDNDVDGLVDCNDDGCAEDAACAGGGDADTDADADSDTDTDTDSDSDADSDADADADADHTIPCNDRAYDAFEIDTLTGGTVVVRVDTISAATTFDPWSEMYSSIIADFGNSPTVAEGDDDFDCTFPPPEFSCPEITYTSPGGRLGFLTRAYSETCNTSGVGAYRISATLNGNPVTPILRVNDGMVDPGGTGGFDTGFRRRSSK